ncbi:Uncharacterized protein dnl_39480 [Desulfonema limicola]|uniref:Uncharacterized protein n=1 Tax=Desulfonema limicola TaxID=45656 RepID=A0A975BAE5_9BACT|nr:hypothetical protein [Desulfonema limicola]QTA81609.1 Uncharacterized protein dnl_39480 [Desulfonema limicola]
MKTITYSPLRTSVIFGLMCAIGFIPVNTVLGSMFSYPLPFRFTIWLCLCFYSLLLVKWADKKTGSLFFPLMLLFICIYMVPTGPLYLVLTLAVLSWIRSGLCFTGPLLKTIPAELVICFGSGFLAQSFSPNTSIKWAGVIWLFFLCQSVYFVFFGKEFDLKNNVKASSDTFEHARKQAEKMLISL